MDVREIETPSGLARAHLQRPAGALRGRLVLGHGAGGGIGAPDLVAAAREAVALGYEVALTEQPYRVLGRRSPAPAARLDAAWTAICAALHDGTVPLVTGGRSSGARVACRTASATGAAAVLCLAFPLLGPRDRPSRQPELDAVDVPVLVVQGATDSFSMPEPAAPLREVVTVAGDHALKRDVPAVAAAVREFLRRVAG